LEPGVLFGFCTTLVLYQVDLTTSPATITTVVDFTPYIPPACSYIDNTGELQPTTLSFIGWSNNDNRAYIGYEFTDWGETTQPNGQPKGAPFFVFDLTLGEIVWTLSSFDPTAYYKPNSDRIVSRVDSGFVSNPNQPPPTSTYFADIDARVQWQDAQTENVLNPVDEMDAVGQHCAFGVDTSIQGCGYINPENANVQSILRRDFDDWHRLWTITAMDRFAAPNTWGIPNGLYFSMTGGDQRWCTQTVVSQSGYDMPGDGEVADFDTAGKGNYRRYCHHNGNWSGQYENRGLANKSITNKLIVFSSEWIGTIQDPGNEYFANVYVVATGLQTGTYHEETPVDAPAYADQIPLTTPWPQTPNVPEYANMTTITIPGSMLKVGLNLLEIMVPFAPYGYGPQPAGLLIQSAFPVLSTPGSWQIRDPQSAAVTWMPPGGTLVPATVCTNNIPGVWYQPTSGAQWIGPYADPYGPTGQGQSNQPVFSCAFHVNTPPANLILNLVVCTYVVRIAVNHVTLRVPSVVGSLPQFQPQTIAIGVLGPDLSWTPPSS
jgi:hypothetical protein